MGRSIEVPVTTSVLLWATEESGYDREQIARSVGVSLAVFDQWLSGKNKPNLTQTRKLAKKLHRPLAALLSQNLLSLVHCQSNFDIPSTAAGN